MNGRIWLRILAAVVLVAAIAGVAGIAFNAGVATHIQVPAGGAQPPYPYFGFGFWHPFGFLGCLAPLFGLLLVFLAFRALSFLFWGPRWGYGHHMRHAWRHGWTDEQGVPPMFREWHDRAHGQPPASDQQSKSE